MNVIPNKTMNAKRKTVLDRIESIRHDIGKAREYLESGQHAHWSKFRPLFVHKLKDGKELPPHKDWVRNVFLPGKESALRRAEKTIERLEKRETSSHAGETSSQKLAKISN